MVASAHTHGAADDIGLAVMGVRGLHDLGQIIEDNEESEEEKREREARNAGSALGAVVGIAAGLALGIDDDTEDNENDDYEDEDEDDDGFLCVMCPNCGDTIYIEETVDPEDVVCPSCQTSLASVMDDEDEISF